MRCAHACHWACLDVAASQRTVEHEQLGIFCLQQAVCAHAARSSGLTFAATRQRLCGKAAQPHRARLQTYQEDDVGLGVAVPVHRVLVADATEILLPFHVGIVWGAGIVRDGAAV